MAAFRARLLSQATFLHCHAIMPNTSSDLVHVVQCFLERFFPGMSSGSLMKLCNIDDGDALHSDFHVLFIHSFLDKPSRTAESD